MTNPLLNPTMIVDIWGRNASKIDDNHWQSGFPYPFGLVPEHGVDVIVLTATDAQPGPNELANLKRVFPKLGGILCPFDDTESPRALPEIVKIAECAADRVVERLAQGKSVLVTCSVGRNRSGLVSALVLMKRHKISGAEAVARVRAGRNPSLPEGEGALTNKTFAAYLMGLRAPQGAK